MTTEARRAFAGRFRMLAMIAALAALAFPALLRADDGCGGSGDYSYLCGPVNAEDLVLVPDNLHSDNEGNLITAGLEISDPVCGDVPMSQAFDFEKFASCPRPFTVLSIDPESLDGRVIASSPAQEHFSNITMALETGSELWVGTFAGDRIAYTDLQRGEKQ